MPLVSPVAGEIATVRKSAASGFGPSRGRVSDGEALVATCQVFSHPDAHDNTSAR